MKLYKNILILVWQDLFVSNNEIIFLIASLGAIRENNITAKGVKQLAPFFF